MNMSGVEYNDARSCLIERQGSIVVKGSHGCSHHEVTFSYGLHHGHLLGHRAVAVEDAESTFLSQGSSQWYRSNRIHSCRENGGRKLQALGELSGEVGRSC